MASATPSEIMPCAAVLERLEAAVDGELDDAEAARIEIHLGNCTRCATEHRLALAIKTELRALPSLDTPSEVIASVLRQAETARSTSRNLKARHRQIQPPRPWQQEPQRRSSFSQRGPRRMNRFSGRYLALAAALLLTLASGALWLETLRDGDTLRETDGITTAAADPVEVTRATEEARYALAYLKQIHRRAGLKIRQDLLIERLVQPTVRSLSLPSRLDNSQDEDSAGRPDRS